MSRRCILNSFQPCLFLRSELFGGILADSASSKVRFLEPTAFFIVEQIVEGRSDDQIIQAMRENFGNTDGQDLRTHISICRNMIRDFQTDDVTGLLVEDDAPAVPTLKAPLDLKFEITRRCNLSCAHCYNVSGTRVEDQLSWSYIRIILEQLDEDRLRFATVTGGEPLLHPELPQIMQAIRRITERLTFSTNGTLFTPSLMDLIADTADTVNISLDAACPEDHDRFRGVQKAHQKALAAIRALAARGIDIVVQTTVNRLNCDSLRDLGYLVDEAGAKVWSVRLPLASGRFLQNQGTFLSADEVRAREESIASLREEGYSMRVFAGIPVPWSRHKEFEETDLPNPLIACAAATVMAAVLADRSLTPCILFSGTEYYEPMPDPTQFKRLWRESEYFNRLRRMRLHDVPLCSRCSHYGSVCRTECRAKSVIFFGDLATPDPDCDFARAESRTTAPSQNGGPSTLLPGRYSQTTLLNEVF